MKAPVVLFAYNRPRLLEEAIRSLSNADGADETELFIFVDGPRTDADAPKVSESLRIAREAGGFGKVHVQASDRNRGLAASVIAGVGEVISAAGKVIVLEDDLRVTKDFLAWMNAALDRLAASPRVVLWVLKENKRAIRFYDKCGFRPDGTEKYVESVGAAVVSSTVPPPPQAQRISREASRRKHRITIFFMV